MKHNLDEKQVEELLVSFSPNITERLEQRLSNAPWTAHAVARRRLITSAAIAVLTIAVLVAATPQGRALAQSVLRYFVQAEGEAITLPITEAELVPVTAEVVETQNTLAMKVEGCGSVLTPHCSISEVRALVDFPILELDSARDQLHFIGATISEHGSVILAYQTKEGVLNLAQVPAAHDDIQQWRVGPSTTVEAVAIGNRYGEYVRGGWFGMGLEEGTISWDADAALQTLRWEENGIQYTLWFVAAKTSDGTPSLDKSALVELAATLRIPLESANATPTPELSAQQAGAVAGFTVTEPRTLPTGFTFSKAVYSSQYNAVCLLYRYHPDDHLPAMVLFESNWALPADEEIQVKASYNGVEVEIATEVESIPVQGAAGETATLITTGLDSSRLCAGEQAHANRALFWQSSGRSFVLFASLDQLDGRGFLTKLEMRRLAEDLNGVQSPFTIEIDPERMTSVESVERFSGLDVKVPSLMLADLRLDHIAYKNYGPYRSAEGETMIALLYTGRPVDDGRADKILIMQTFSPTNTLENLTLAGGYEAKTVNGWPAIYQQSCWDAANTGGRAGCRQHLVWFEDGIQLEIEVFLPTALPRETLIEIAESMR